MLSIRSDHKINTGCPGPYLRRIGAGD